MSKIYDCIKYYNKNYPNNISFTYREGNDYKNINYGELFKYINNISGYLKEYKNKTIAIIGNNKIEYAVSLLSIVCNIGNAFLIDKELQKEDMEKILKKKKPDLIIVDDDINISFNDFKTIKFSDISKNMKKYQKYNYDKDYSGSLILHTSGTTGEVKCVLLNEEKYFGVIKELNKKWNVTMNESCLLIIPLYHIYALTSLFHGLYAGINNILEWDYKRLNNVLKETKPHLFMGVPLMYNKIKDSIFEKSEKKIKIAIIISNILLKIKIDIRRTIFKKIHNYFGGNYRFGCSAGSLLPYETNKFFNDIGLPIYNVYGMTETSGPIAINYKCHNDYKSVGETLDVNKIKIINKNAAGIGNILVKGKNVFDGYINDKKHPYFSDDYFDTGDLGYVNNNYLYIVGRKKNILIGDNGKNISPEELNKKILKNNKIHDCNIIMENNRLIALVNSELSDAELNKYINKINSKLPNYKKIYRIRNTSKKIK